MAPAAGPRYGTPNMQLIGRWLGLPAEDDGPFWALNLMRYRDVAEYADGRDDHRSGREADEAYTPVEPLRAIGARITFGGDVVEQLRGEPAWHRVGIVRYPSRSAFLAMQRRDDFKAKHVHKEAGMEFTIVMCCLPTGRPSAAGGDAVIVVERGPARPLPEGVVEEAAFDVEGVIIGDDRRYERARLLRVAGPEAREALAGWAGALDDAHVVAVAPRLDELTDSILEVQA